MRILIACEFSGIVRDAFIKNGHNAVSCDLLMTERVGPHIQGNVLDHLEDGWDLMIAHPPCTHIAISGARWFKEKITDGRQQEGVDFFMRMVSAPIRHIAVENPVGIMSRMYRRPDQKIQPWQYGDSVQKTTCLWLKNLPALQPTNIVDRGNIYVDPRNRKHGGEFVMLAKRSFSPLMLLAPGEERWKIRSRTFRGIAQAMADQWGWMCL